MEKIMNIVREKVLEDMNPYVDFAKHKDLVAFTIGADYFSYDCEADEELEADFIEVIAVVEKDWLFTLMLKEEIENPLDYLQNVYTWDDGFAWFENAKTSGKIVAVEFN